MQPAPSDPAGADDAADHADPPRLFCFGFGYCAQALAHRRRAAGWHVVGTSRSAERRAELSAMGLQSVPFGPECPLPAGALDGTTHLLTSIPPEQDGDPVLAVHAQDLRRLPALRWVGVLSTTGVYGDRGGDWVDEATPPRPGQARTVRRVAQEAAWLASGLPVHVFRLAGIYGPGRSALDEVRAGRARRMDKPGQVFGRIHVDDITRVLEASIARPEPGAIYNVCDDEPSPTHEVVAEACRLLGVDPPPLVPFDPSVLSPMAQAFYAESRRVRNERIKRDLGVRLAYPSYREGLRALLTQTAATPGASGGR